MLKQNASMIATNSRKLSVERPRLGLKKTGTRQKRYCLSLARKSSRPGIFEMLGSYELNIDDAELFGDDRYRRLMNLLIYRSQM